VERKKIMIPLWSFIIAFVLFIGMLFVQLVANKKLRTLYNDTSFILGCYIAKFGFLNEVEIKKIAVVEETKTSI